MVFAEPLMLSAIKQPEVSVVIPNKGRTALLLQAIESLSAQKLSAWEAIIVDDGSSDNDLATIRHRIKDEPRIRLIERTDEPAGANRCRNLGWSASVAPLLVFLDSDDCLSAECLAARVAAMTSDGNLDFAVFPHQHFRVAPGDRSDVWALSPDEDHLERFLRMHIPWQTAGPTWRKSALDAVGPWDESLPSGQDWNFHLRALIAGLRYRVFSSPYFYHRVSSPERETISGRKRGLADVSARVGSLGRVSDGLRSAGLLSNRRRGLLARLYLSLAEQLLQLNQPHKAQRTWSECREKDLISLIDFDRGRRLLGLSRWRIARGVYRRTLRALHSSDLLWQVWE